MIRPGTTSDIAAIDSFDVFAGDRSAEINESRLLVWVADSQVVAYITIAGFAFHRCPYVEFLCVDPAHRRRGIGSALLRHIESMHAGKRLLVSTEDNNAEMLSLLASLDYQYAGSLSGLNPGPVAEVFYFKDVAQL